MLDHFPSLEGLSGTRAYPLNVHHKWILHEFLAGVFHPASVCIGVRPKLAQQKCLASSLASICPVLPIREVLASKNL
jgi:hypothetical protein